MLANHHAYYRLACLTGTFKIIASAVYYQVSLGGYQTISIGSCLFICRGSTSFIESITSQNHPAKRTSADMELRNYPKPKHLSS